MFTIKWTFHLNVGQTIGSINIADLILFMLERQTQGVDDESAVSIAIGLGPGIQCERVEDLP